jgi:TRAP-type C4-dicarboxylate transport system permease small subunit
VRGGSELSGESIEELTGKRRDSPADPRPPRPAGPLGILARGVDGLNRVMLIIGMTALVAAALILTYSVFSRYIFKAATDWQDEAAVFCIVGAVFLCGGYVQSWRGHIGIEALASILPPAVNRVRIVVVDLVSLLFCAFFAWKSWTLLHEAWVDKMTSNSTWAPPLSIPYGLMTAGMTLLALQVLLQLLAHFVPEGERTT